jgi:hypothetical protein
VFSRGSDRMRELQTVDVNQCGQRLHSKNWLLAYTTVETLMLKLGVVVAALFLPCMLAGHGANAAGGCGAGLHRDRYGRCQFDRAYASHVCSVGFIWRNGRCRQNVGNDPFVSTWPNAPR